MHSRQHFALLLLMLTFALSSSFLLLTPVHAAGIYYVAPNGDDANSGLSTAAPLRTIQRCADLAQPGDTCQISPGVYRETVRPPRSGTAAAPISFSGDPAAAATISALHMLEPGRDGVGTWQRHSPTIARIQLSPTHDLGVGRNVLFVDGMMQMEARWPNVAAPTRLHRNDYAISSAGDLTAFENGTATGLYRHPGISPYWAGGRISFSPGHEWWGFWGDVTAASAGEVQFSFPLNANQEAHARPHRDDPFFLWGKLEALDAPGEFFLDRDGAYGPANTLYLYATGDPNALQVELKARNEVIALADRTDLRFSGLHFMGGRVSSGPNAARVQFDRIESYYGGNHNLRDGWDAAAFDLRGSEHRLSNSTIAHVSSAAITIRGPNHLIDNNIIYDTGFIIASSDGVQVYGSVGSTISNNTIFDTSSVAISAATLQAGFVIHNRTYRIATQKTDIAAINAWNGGDGQGTQIAYNLVHDVLAYYEYADPAAPHWGGTGIRLDSGGAPLGNSNYSIHHNVVFNTTASGIAVWGLSPEQLNYGDTGILVANNTLSGNLHLKNGPISHAGTSISNNIVGGEIWLPEDHAAVVQANLLAHNSVAGNLSGDPAFVYPHSWNLTLRSDSPAIDAGMQMPPLTDGYLGIGPEIGAYEYGATPFVAGALLRAEDLADLRVRCDGTVCRIEGLPLGRHLPAGFTVQVGSARSNDCDTALNPVTDQIWGRCNLDLAVGSYQAAVSPDGVSFTNVAEQVQVRSLSIDAVDPPSTLVGVGRQVSVSGAGFSGGAHTRLPLSFEGLNQSDLVELPVPLRIDTSRLIADGLIAADCSDLAVEEEGGATQYAVWVESGCNSTATLVWLRARPANASQSRVIAFDDQPARFLTRDPAANHERSAIFPALSRSDVKVWLAANDVPAGATANWPNRAGSGMVVAQANSAAQPQMVAAQINGLPVVAFDGVDDHFRLGDALGADRHGAVFVVYRNPDPGPTRWQRIYSAVPVEIGNDYEHNGAYYVPPNDGTGVITAQPEPQLNLQRYDATTWDGNPLPTRDFRNFMIGRRNNADIFFRGEIAELIIVNESLSREDRSQIETYLRRKYGLEPVPSAMIAYNAPQPALVVRFGDAPCTQLLVHASEQLTCMVPAQSQPGAVDVTVIDGAGTQAILTAGFSYLERQGLIFMPLLALP